MTHGDSGVTIYVLETRCIFHTKDFVMLCTQYRTVQCDGLFVADLYSGQIIVVCCDIQDALATDPLSFIDFSHFGFKPLRKCVS